MAAEGVVRAIKNLKRFGVDKGDEAWYGELNDACSALAQASPPRAKAVAGRFL